MPNSINYFVAQTISATAVPGIIQPNPDPFYQDTLFGAYGDRQTVAVGGGCGSGFGGDSRECAPLMATLTPLFAGGETQLLSDACRNLPIDVIIAHDTDPAWRDRSSWVWTGAPVFSNEFVRMFACRPSAALTRRTPG